MMEKQKNRWAQFVCTITYYAVVAICGVAALQFLSWAAPWRERQIRLATLAAFVISIACWHAAGRRRCFRVTLYTAALGFSCLFMVGWYLAFTSHFHEQFPSVDAHVRYQADDGDPNRQVSPEQLMQIVRNKDGHASRLRRFLFESVDDDEVISEADLIMANQYRLLEYEPVKLGYNLSWSESPYDDPSWNWQLHNMGLICFSGE